MNEDDLRLAIAAYEDRLGQMAKRYEREICQLRIQLTKVSKELEAERDRAVEKENVQKEED